VDFAGLTLGFANGLARPLRVEDVHAGYVAGLNDPEVNRYLAGVRERPQTLDTATEYVRQNQEADAAILFGVWETGRAEHCGTVRLYQIEDFNRTAYIGVCLFERRAWGRGLAAGALRAVTEWAFDALKLRWIEAAMHVDNHASERAFRAAGYAWLHDVDGKYLLDGQPTLTRFLVARNPVFFEVRRS
jgi:RimJ/RimL family protein N-acetyltransferase